MKVHVISLGCSKNLVDAERLTAMLEHEGVRVMFNSEPDQISEGDAVVVNTCGFIADAKEESVNEILSYAQLRTSGQLSGLYVMGCLSQRYREELPCEIPEVDGWFGKTDWAQLAELLGDRREPEEAGVEPGNSDSARHLSTPRHYAYLKISEGCDRHCAFCAIPLITGRHRSRPIEHILREVRALVRKGVKEFNVIAQELTGYGRDLVGKPLIADLVEQMAQVPGVEIIRLHYAYPAGFPLELLDVMARHDNVAKYLDIALQHIADPVLERMNRHITAEQTRSLLREMRTRVPGLHIRTTLMVGFPGETDEDFNALLEFVREQRFERMGAFAYCEEEDTPAAKLHADNVSQSVKQYRLDKLMALQEQISLEIQQEKVGQVLRVMIDREEEEFFIGRTQWDSPEVDPEVLVKKDRRLAVGQWADVRITQALPFELMGEVE